MVFPFVVAALVGLQTPDPQASPAPAAASSAAPLPEVKPLKSFSFGSKAYAFLWDKVIPLDLEVDGLQVKSIFFNEREPKNRFLKGRKFGNRAQLEVTNTSTKSRIPGFAVAVLDEEGRLLGAATGGTKFGNVKAGETETFDLNFFQVKQRLRRGAKFVLSLELRD